MIFKSGASKPGNALHGAFVGFFMLACLGAQGMLAQALPDLIIDKSHSGSFPQGSFGNSYSVLVSNTGSADKAAGSLVSVTDLPPSGLLIVGMNGSGWTCTILPTCERTDLLAAGSSYPAITVIVNVSATATSPQVNSVAVTTTATESNTGNNTADDPTSIGNAFILPDLIITKSHVGSFAQGSTGNTYTVVVKNAGLGSKLAGSAVNISETPSSGLTVTNMSGTGWSCATVCTRSDTLLAGNFYPPLTITVSVAAAATSPQVNRVQVSTFSTESNTLNNISDDSTAIGTDLVLPDLTIFKSHVGNFAQGSTGNTYSVVVRNVGAVDKPAGKSVIVTDVAPLGLLVTAMSGTGWTCTTLPTCTRTDVLTPASSYPPITVTVSVAVGAPSPRVNSVRVTTAEESNTGNNLDNDSTEITTSALPDLTISKSHVGSFPQGSAGNTYSVRVSNSGAGDKATGSSVTVTDAPPSGLTITAMSGTGWTCTVLPTCTRTDLLGAGNTYQAIIVTVSVGATATSPQVNSVVVSTAAAESNTGNNTANDSTVISTSSLLPDLTIGKSHVGSFAQGSTGNTYSVTVSNGGAGDKAAGSSVTVTDAPPSGLTITAMSGTGWSCTILPTCTRTDLLAPGGSYPAITVTVSVGATATSPQVNSVVVSTGGESNAGNNTANDSTVITSAPLPDLTINKTHVGSFVQGSTGNTYSVQVKNIGTGDKAAGLGVTVTDTPPSGLTITAMGGSGWTCAALPTCTRTDLLGAGNSYPAITVTVSVGVAATSPQVNSISVSTEATESNNANNTATDPTEVIAPLPSDLTISKSHVGNFVNGSAGNLYIVVVTNGGAGDKAAGSAVTVTDTPPTGLTITAMGGPGWTCTTLPTCSRTDILAAGSSYPAVTVTVSIAATTSPLVNSVTVTTAATESNTANNTATDSTVINTPDLTVSKSHTGNFAQGQIGATYAVLVTNSGTGPTTGAVVTVTDTLPVGLTATAMAGSGWTCNVGSVSCTSTAIVAAGSSFPSITLTVNVAPNALANIINGVAVTGGGETNTTNNAANDPTVINPTDSFHVRYAANLTSGDSVINITNTGANGAALNGPGFGGAAGNICVNVYAFSPDEQLVSCCSCLLTPNGLVSLSVNSDLISNTLTGVRPNSVVVKLVNTAAGAGFTGTSCTNSAALAGGTSFPLAGGMLAYGTTIHGAPVAGTFGVAETPFLKATLSPAELASITNRCTNIVGNGSTFGICRSCRVGGLGSIQ